MKLSDLPIGTRIHIINAGNGAHGADGHDAQIVSPQLYCDAGLIESDPHIKVKLLDEIFYHGRYWNISTNAEFQIIEKVKGYIHEEQIEFDFNSKLS